MGRTGAGSLFWYLESWQQIQKHMFPIESISGPRDPNELKMCPTERRY